MITLPSQARYKHRESREKPGVCLQLGIGWAGGIVNGVMIAVFNQVYGRIAEGLTEWENHK